MSRSEIEEKIEDLEQKRFYLHMKDHMSSDDSARDTQYAIEIQRLQARLDEK